MSTPAIQWIDNHCHLDGYDDVGALLAESHAAGVQELVCVGVDVATSTFCLELASRHDHVWGTAGVHPHDAAGGIEGLEELIKGSVGDLPRPVAVGECGLDHHYDHSPSEDQREVFARQIGLANHYGLPLVIHTREAWDETFEILDTEGIPPRTVFHCFTGGPEEATACLDRGAMLSISGIVTFRSAEDVQEAVAAVPLDRLMVETDSPFLAPVPNRGKTNRPAWVGLVGEAVAAIKQIPVDEVASVTVENSRAFYGLGESGT